MSHWKLLKRKEIWFPTTRGFFLLFIIVCLFTVSWIYTVHDYLAQDLPIASRTMVVEGWLPDHAVTQAIEVFDSQGYQHMVVVGGGFLKGGHLSQYKSLADQLTATFKKLGLPDHKITTIVDPAQIKDRTFSSALLLKEWLMTTMPDERAINLVTVGAHARRSRLLFEKALGDGYSIGVINIENTNYDSSYWWKSSNGVREVIGETIAYIYARFFFYPN